jgi:agmatine deiminase
MSGPNDLTSEQLPSEGTSNTDLQSGKTPRELGYRMPAEWELHAATWLSWPHKEASWPGNFAPIPKLYAHLIRTLSQHEPVNVLAGGDEVFAQASALVGNVANVTLHQVQTDDAWLRDSGPSFLVAPNGGKRALVNWGYNAWGGKYPPYEFDDLIPVEIAAITKRHVFTPGIIMEGGSFDINGAGTLLTSEQCLLNDNRNPQLDRAGIEKYLGDYLNIKKVLWLKRGIAGDDTDGHIDELARFVGPRTIVAPIEKNEADENYAPLRENFELLQSFTDQDGEKLEVIALPMTEPLFYDGQRLPTSYCNFYIANGVVVVPQYDTATDPEALDILRPLFPGREVVGIRARELVWGLGAFHCISQQEPA